MKLTETQITSANARQLLEQGLASIRAGDPLVDLSAVQRCDSSAVALMLAWKREAKERAVALKFSGVPAAAASLASLYGVAELLG